MPDVLDLQASPHWSGLTMEEVIGKPPCRSAPRIAGAATDCQDFYPFPCRSRSSYATPCMLFKTDEARRRRAGEVDTKATLPTPAHGPTRLWIAAGARTHTSTSSSQPCMENAKRRRRDDHKQLNRRFSCRPRLAEVHWHARTYMYL
uniref:Expressed protein n=1 Tax=Oryza sativa subsp. japonica TaxID=39947 RepID=Q2QZL8_ORYSJ|nr:expressed protein [Oryza sativa Japonica Group]